MSQAGSLLADTGLDVEVDLRLLDERADELLAEDNSSTFPVSTAALWRTVFDRLGADDQAALDLMTLVAWCGPDPLPLTIFTEKPDFVPDCLRRRRRT